MDNISEIINQMNFATLGWQVIATLIFILGDIISGFIGALIQKTLDSQKMREGLLRKFLLILVIMLGFVVHYAFNLPIISKVVCAYIIVMEAVSILENLKKAGVELGKLGDLLKIKTGVTTITNEVTGEVYKINEEGEK